MKTNILRTIFLLSCITYLTGACKKSADKVSPDQPVITVVSPAEGSTYTGSVTMSFSLSSVTGLDSCYLSIVLPSAASAIYYNSFSSGAAVRNKTSFNFSGSQTTLPATLTDAQCIIRAVDLNKTTTVRTINIKVKQ